MRKTDPRMFYELGRSLDELKRLSYATSAPEIVLALYNPNQWLSKFLAATDGEEVPLAKSREAATNLLRLVRRVNDAMLSALKKSAKESLGSDNVRCLFELLDNFEAEFAHECRELAAFIVTQKGLFSTPLLIEAAEGQFSKNQRAVMPQKTISDIQQAGRCLAFELPTACAFHVCRATEALMLEYLHLLTGKKWSGKNPGWGTYNRELIALGAPPEITNRLEELRKDRNSYLHPEITVSLEDAPVVFGSCNHVMTLMAKEIEKLHSKAVVSP